MYILLAARLDTLFEIIHVFPPKHYAYRKVLVRVTAPCSTCPIIRYKELGSAKQTWSILILVQHLDLFVSRSSVHVHFALRVFLYRCSQLKNSHSH